MKCISYKAVKALKTSGFLGANNMLSGFGTMVVVLKN